jgi:tetratricopeptide (TPR) repeat protein
MRIGDRKIRLALLLVLVLALGGFAVYQVDLYLEYGSHYRLAEQALQRRDFSQASLHLKQCLGCWPGDRPSRLLAAQTARRQGDFATALEHLKVYQENNGPPEPLNLEHRLFRIQQSDLTEGDLGLSFCAAHPEAGETPLILEACIEGSLKALGTTRSLAMVEEGGELAPHMALAQRALDQWFELRDSPVDQAQGLIWRSRLAHLANKVPKAVADLRRAIELDPNSIPARLQLALFVAAENPTEAAGHLYLLRQQAPTNTQVGLALAGVQRSLGQLEQAKQVLDELREASPNDVALLLQRGQVALDLQQVDEAERLWRRALELAPNHPAVRDRLQQLERERNRQP